MANPWFRLYSEIIDDEKIRLLAFEDRWHYVALLALKNTEYLDKEQDALFRRGLEVKLGVTGVDLDNLKQRLIDVKLIDDCWQPHGWDDRQFKSDSSKERVRKYREKKKKRTVKQECNVTVTAQDTDTEEDKDKEGEEAPPIASLKSRAQVAWGDVRGFVKDSKDEVLQDVVTRMGGWSSFGRASPSELKDMGFTFRSLYEVHAAERR